VDTAEKGLDADPSFIEFFAQ